MALTYHTLTLIKDKVPTSIPEPGTFELRPFTDNQTLNDVDGERVWSGVKREVNKAGGLRWDDIPALPQAGITPADAKWELLWYPAGSGAPTLRWGPFELTGDMTLRQLNLVTGISVPPTALDQLDSGLATIAAGPSTFRTEEDARIEGAMAIALDDPASAVHASLTAAIATQLWLTAPSTNAREFGDLSEIGDAANAATTRATIQAVCDHIGANGGRVEFPAGLTCYTDDAIVITRATAQDWQEYDFNGMRLKRLAAGTANPMFTFDGGGVFGNQTGPMFKKLQITGNNRAVEAFRIRDAGRTTFKEIIVRDVTGAAWRVENYAGHTENCTWDDITVQNCGLIGDYYGAADLGGPGTDSFARQVWNNVQGGNLTTAWWRVNTNANPYHSVWSKIKGNMNANGVAIWRLLKSMPNAFIDEVGVENVVGTAYVFDVTGVVGTSAGDSGGVLPRLGRISNVVPGSSLQMLTGTGTLAIPPYTPKQFSPDGGHFAKLDVDKIVNNSTALVDTALKVYLEPNATYVIEGNLLYNASAAADAKFALTYPAGCSGRWTANGLQNTTTTPVSPINRGDTGVLSQVATSGGAAANAVALPSGLVTSGAGPGWLTLQFAQNTADASDAILRAGSWLRLSRVA